MSNNCCEERNCETCSEKTSVFSHKEYYELILNNVFSEWYLMEYDNTILLTKSKPLILLALSLCRYDEYIKITFKDNYEEF